MKKRMLCCLLALVFLAVGRCPPAAPEGGGLCPVWWRRSRLWLLGGANASSGVVVAQKEIKVERDSSRKIKQLNVVGQRPSQRGPVYL